LALTGLARLLVEFIRINPRSAFGLLTNAQVVSLLSMVAGVALMFVVRAATGTGRRKLADRVGRR
jgi:prolipoprotein diacylglyceryltransferase